MKTNNRILISGANGFVGSTLCNVLQNQGYTVVPLVRRSGFSPDEIVFDDIAKLGDIEIQPGDIVIHLAAKVHESSQDNDIDYHRVNVEGTKKIARLAAHNKASQFIFISSAHVNGIKTHGKAFSETDVLNKFCSSYAKSKYLAEQAVHSIFAGTQTCYTILRPTLIYGPGVKGNLTKLVFAIEKNIPLPLRAMTSPRHFLYLDNFISSILKVIQCKAQANEQVFLVSDNESASTAQLISHIAKVKRSHTALFYMPKILLKIICKVLGKKEALDKLSCEFLVNNQHIQTTLQWHPPYTFEEGITRSFKSP